MVPVRHRLAAIRELPIVRDEHRARLHRVDRLCVVRRTATASIGAGPRIVTGPTQLVGERRVDIVSKKNLTRSPPAGDQGLRGNQLASASRSRAKSMSLSLSSGNALRLRSELAPERRYSTTASTGIRVPAKTSL